MEFWKWERKICNSFERARLQIEEGHRPLKFNRDTIIIRNTNVKRGLRGKFVIPLSKRGQQIEGGLTTQSVLTSKLMQLPNNGLFVLKQHNVPEIIETAAFCKEPFQK